MDKGKNRTDLLAAGRRKLQQYRQKETKSSNTHGKSLKKSSKEELDLDADTSSVSGKFSSEFQPDGEELPDIGIKSELYLSENSTTSDIKVEDAGTLVIPALHRSDRAEVQSTELPLSELSSCEYVDCSVVNTEADVSVGRASDMIISEVDNKSFDDSVSVGISAKSGSVVALESVGLEVQVEGRDGTGDASSSSRESILPLFPIQEMENQGQCRKLMVLNQSILMKEVE